MHAVLQRPGENQVPDSQASIHPGKTRSHLQGTVNSHAISGLNMDEDYF